MELFLLSQFHIYYLLILSNEKIAILGSTGSIGKTLIDIIDKNKKNFEIKLLTANKNYKTLLEQAEKFKVKNIIIT